MPHRKLQMVNGYMALDSVHLVKDVFQLALHLHTSVLAQCSQFVTQLIKSLDRLGQIHNHHHIEILLQNGLGDVKDVDLIVCQISADLGDDTNGIFAHDSNNSSCHIVVLR